MKKKLAAVVLSMVLCLGASVTTLAAGSPSANNSSTTTSQTTTAATEVKVEQKAITQDALNDVQKEKLSGYLYISIEDNMKAVKVIYQLQFRTTTGITIILLRRLIVIIPNSTCLQIISHT